MRLAPDADQVRAHQAVTQLRPSELQAQMAFAGTVMWTAGGTLTGYDARAGLKELRSITVPGLKGIAARGSDLWAVVGTRVLLLSGRSLASGS